MADRAKLWAWWAHRQGLLARETISPREVLSRFGWARSVGGANPYLTLHARTDCSRGQAEAAAAERQIHELPSARGCTYVLPDNDFALGLAMGQGFGETAQVNQAKKYLGYTDAEHERLCDDVLAALGAGPLDPKDLRSALGDKVHNFGDEGKKRGTTTALPLALGSLQAQGKIRRIAANGRLDTQTYAYALWSPSPLDGWALSPTEAATELARRYFAWTGAASLAHYQWFSGLGVKASKDALEPLGLVPLDGFPDLLALPESAREYQAFVPPSRPVYRMVSCIDSALLLRRNAADMVAEADFQREMVGERGRIVVGGIQDLANNAILDRGRIVGVWEFDPAEGEIVYEAWTKVDDAMREEIERTEAFIRDELGDARSFSLDSPASRAPKIAALRGLSSAPSA